MHYPVHCSVLSASYMIINDDVERTKFKGVHFLNILWWYVVHSTQGYIILCFLNYTSLGKPETVFPPKRTVSPRNEPRTDSLKLVGFSRK